MSLSGGIGRSRSDGGSRPRAGVAYEEQRRTIAGSLQTAGTLACPGCDAPIGIGEDPIRLTDELSCPFCARRGPARAFLSLRRPTRPQRVLVRLVVRSAAGSR